MDLQAKLDATIQEHNELHANIQAGEAQLAAMREQRQRLLGRVAVLQEILQDGEEASCAMKKGTSEAATEQLIKTDDPTEE